MTKAADSTDQSLTDEDLAQWITELSPARGQATIRSRHSLGSFHHRVEVVTVEHAQPRDSVAEYVLRVLLGRLSWWTLDAPDMPERERVALEVARKAGVPLARELGRRTNPHAVLLKRIGGVRAEQPWTCQVARDAADHLAKLHRTDVSARARKVLPDAGLSTLRERWRRWSREIDSPWPRLAIALSEPLGADEHEATMLHGDFHYRNVLLHEGSVAAIIDWEEGALGDPRWDLAAMVASLGVESSQAAAFLEAYREHVQVSVDGLDEWILLRRVRDFVLTEWIRHQWQTGGSIPPTRVDAWLRHGAGLGQDIAEWMASLR